MIKNLFENLDEYVVLVNDDKEQIKNKLNYEVKAIYNPTSFKQEEKSKLINKKFIAMEG